MDTRTQDSLTNDMIAPSDTRWFRIALQVNPWQYLKDNSSAELIRKYPTEEDFNAQMVTEAKSNGIDAVAITDHWRGSKSIALSSTLKSNGVTVFPGFEATSHEGVHCLVIFDPQVDWRQVDLRIGECGIRMDQMGKSTPSPTFSLTELFEKAIDWGALAIPAHVERQAGLITTMTGQARVQAWTDENLSAIGVATEDPTCKGTKQEIGSMLDFQGNYARKHPVPILEAADVIQPNDLTKRICSSYFKMSHLSIEGLRHALRLPETRCSNQSPRIPETCQLREISWSGGYLDGQRIRFSNDLTTLIGGRGSGKSTVLESIREVLGTVSPSDRVLEDSGKLIAANLKGSEIHLVIQWLDGSLRTATKVIGSSSDTEWCDERGLALSNPASELSRQVQIFSQGELAELARDDRYLTTLLEAFAPAKKRTSRPAVEVADEMRSLDERMSDIEEELAKLDTADLEYQRLCDSVSRVEEGGVDSAWSEAAEIRSTLQMVQSIRTNLVQTSEFGASEIDLSTTILALRSYDSADLPQTQLSCEAIPSLCSDLIAIIDGAVSEAKGVLACASAMALRRTDAVISRVSERLERAESDAEHSVVCSGVSINYRDYSTAKARISELDGVRRQAKSLSEQLKGLNVAWSRLSRELNIARDEDLHRAERAGCNLKKRTDQRIEVSVFRSVDVDVLAETIRTSISGRLDKILPRLTENIDVVREVAIALEKGTSVTEIPALEGVPSTQCGLIDGGGPALGRRLELLESPIRTDIRMDLSPEHCSANPVYRSVDQMSVGQRAAALLIVMLSGKEGVVVVDQPEDDLDNHFIADSVIPMMTKLKGRVQLIVASHNANIPVLGDSEMVVTLAPRIDAMSQVRGEVSAAASGGVDCLGVRASIEELLEGGRRAFEERRYRYGF